MMNTKTIAVLWATCAVAAARPGDLDRTFDPELRAWVAPNMATMSEDGRAWIGGGFDQGDGYSTGDLVRLGENGGVESEPALGYIKRKANLVSLNGLVLNQAASKPFLLVSGDFLLPGESGGWLRMNAAGRVAGKAFSDRLAGEDIIPLFERDGQLWVVRKFAGGQRLLEKRNGADGTLEGAFPQPVNVKAAVPAPGGAFWVLAGDDAPWFDLWGETAPEQQILNLDGDGNVIGAAKVFPGNRDMRLIAGPGGSFRIEFGPDRSRWMYWPAPSSDLYTIEWYSPDGIFERRKAFQVNLGSLFTWAESTDGALMAATGSGTLQFFPAGGTVGSILPAHRSVRSINALPDGKWLIDGLYRLNADGTEDELWSVPELSTPAQVTVLQPLADGRMLAAGNFALVDGIVRNRLVVFRKDGAVDPSFVADDRIGEWRSVAVTDHAIYVATEEPVSYGVGFRSNLVKLGLDGSLMESFTPAIPPTMWQAGPGGFQTLDSVSKVHALKGGDILAVTLTTMEVAQQTVYRLKPDGARDPGFRVVIGFHSYDTLLVREDGGFAKGGVVHRANGTIERDLSKPDLGLSPLCAHLGGVLFLESGNDGKSRLRFWTRRGWASWFSAPALDGAHGIVATPGELGMLYVSAILANGRPTLLRLFPNGRIDRSFRSPAFGHRDRQFAGTWWTAEESGKIAFNPAKHETRSSPRTLIWHPATRRLWASGDFNVVDGKPRDGLARLTGGFAPWRWW
jgi:hypothetical protein